MTQQPGWYADPSGSGALRWWDGASWTEQIRDRVEGDDEGAGDGVRRRPPVRRVVRRVYLGRSASRARRVVRAGLLGTLTFALLAAPFGDDEPVRTKDTGAAERAIETTSPMPSPVAPSPRPSVSAPAGSPRPVRSPIPMRKPPAPTRAPVQPVVTIPRGGVPPVGEWNCPASHPIKGNHGRDDWIYHEPGGTYYDRTKPEECFATAADARAAGYRAPKR